MLADLAGRLSRALPDVPGKGFLVHRILAPLLRGRGIERTVDLKTPAGGRLVCALDDWIPLMVFLYGDYKFERPYARFMLEKARGGGPILDVGANIGYYTVQLARVGGGQVFAFEPGGPQRATLEKNLALNALQNVEVVPLLVSDRAGVERLYWGGARSTGTSSADVVTDVFEDVAATTLDAFCEARGLDAIHLVKIDVEGHEARVLQGMDGLLRAGRVRHLFVELNATTLAAAGTNPRAICDRLAAHGYRAHSIRTGAPQPYRGADESLVYFTRAGGGAP